MNIIIAMLLTAGSHFVAKIWGQDMVDKAVESVALFALRKAAQFTHTTIDDEYVDMIEAKLKQKSAP